MNHPMALIPVVIESPFRAKLGSYTKKDAVRYLNDCLLDSISRGESPYASHAILTRVMDDDEPLQRHRGIVAGYVWYPFAHVIAFYMDLGMPSGMLLARDHCIGNNYRYEERRIR